MAIVISRGRNATGLAVGGNGAVIIRAVVPGPSISEYFLSPRSPPHQTLLVAKLAEKVQLPRYSFQLDLGLSRSTGNTMSPEPLSNSFKGAEGGITTPPKVYNVFAVLRTHLTYHTGTACGPVDQIMTKTGSFHVVKIGEIA